MKNHYFVIIFLFFFVFLGTTQMVYSENKSELDDLSSQQARIEQMKTVISALFVLVQNSDQRAVVESALNDLLSKIDGIQERIQNRIEEAETKQADTQEIKNEMEPAPEPEKIEEIKDEKVEDQSTLGEKQAAIAAKNYLDYTSFSRNGLIDQLVYEGFTRQQAEYGVQAAGY